MRTLVLSSLLLAFAVVTGQAQVTRVQSPAKRHVHRRANAWKLSLPNEICRSANVLEFSALEGIARIPANADYCELPATAMPREVVAVLAKVRAVHARFAAALGRSGENLFGTGVRLHLTEHPAGPIESFTTNEGDGLDNVVLGVFKDFRAERFPERIYAHELVHWLLVEGHLGAHARDLDPNYLFNEGFPDLVASLAMDADKIDFADPTVRSSLRFARDGTPLKTMNRPLREFYLGTFQREPLVNCGKVALRNRTANEKALCSFFRTDAEKIERRRSLFEGAIEREPTAKALAAPFKPESCLLHYKDGTVGLAACHRFQLGPVLISFVRTLGSVLGERPLVTLLAAIDAAGAEMEQYTCAFTHPEAKARTMPATITFASFVRVMKTLRGSLDLAAQAAFDRAWEVHGLDKWAKLEQYDRETVAADFAYLVLVDANPEFAEANRCKSPIPAARGPKCASVCQYIPAP